MDYPLLAVLVLVPVAMATLTFVLRDRRALAAVDVVGSATILALSINVIAKVLEQGPVRYGFLYVDALAALFLGIVSGLSLATSVYSVRWMSRAVTEGEIPAHHVWVYFLALDGFLWTMLLTVTSDNLGVMWISLEGTTIVSALLVGFHGRRNSLEAAWKYIIVNTLGIAFALFGTVLFYAAAEQASVPESSALNWTTLRTIADHFNPAIIRVAFVFIFIGYGTKVGLAPLHAWKPDAYGEAPTPVGALLSGALLKCALFALLRFQSLAILACGAAFTSRLFLLFGLGSLVVAAAMILIQRDAKRLLGYSSVEHGGIIAVGLGFGGLLGAYAALLHAINHAATKALVFFAVGETTARARTREMRRVRGLMEVAPWTATFLLLGVFALAGSPPFAVFIGELQVLRAGLAADQLVAAALFLLPVVTIFGGMVYHVVAMVFGRPHGRLRRTIGKPESGWALLAMAMVAIPVVLLGLTIPAPLDDLLSRAARIATGGAP